MTLATRPVVQIVGVRTMATARPGVASTPNHGNTNVANSFNKTPGGWAEEASSYSEAAVKADRGYHTGKVGQEDLMKLQRQSAKLISRRDGRKAGGR
ncbi:hypothetical protein HKX48_003728 [Thoreauomyces humboldtii]|nr:hypothetical protein HKX48_003728 [Thoreauomyces humboldtii]